MKCSLMAILRLIARPLVQTLFSAKNYSFSPQISFGPKGYLGFGSKFRPWAITVRFRMYCKTLMSLIQEVTLTVAFTDDNARSCF